MIEILEMLVKKSNRILFLLLLSLNILLFCEREVHAELPSQQISSEERYSKLRAQYRKLVISDPEVRDLELWESLKSEFEALLSHPSFSQDKTYRPKALYLFGRLLEQQAGKAPHSEGAGNEAQVIFKELLRDYPNDDLADDSLLGLSRVYHKEKRFAEEREVLLQILSEYPGSTSIPQAKKSLETLYSSKKLKNNNGVQPGSLLVEKDNKEKSSGKSSDAPQPPSLVIGSLESNYPVVMIDPGHGGEEDGAMGPADLKEKDVVLSISRMLKQRLQSETKIRAFLTRSGDETLTLQDRTIKANQMNAELFVSIHANASDYKTGRGVETYYLDNTNDKSSLRLAERENFVKGAPQTDLSFIVSDFIQGVKMDDSISAAHLINKNLVTKLSRSFDEVKNLGVKKAPFYVLVGAHMPCVLVEVSFIDHRVEGRRLATPRYQQVIADGLFEGIVAYLRKKGRI